MSGKELVKRLQQSGWRIARIEGSHHIMKNGKKTVVVPVHGNKDLPKGLLRKILNETGLPEET